MNILIKLEQSDFQGNKEAFDMMYKLCESLNTRSNKSKAETALPEETKAAVKIDVIEDKAPETESSTKAEPEFTLEEVRKTFGGLSKAKGTAAAKGVLESMGAKKISDLTPDKYADAMARIKELS